MEMFKPFPKCKFFIGSDFFHIQAPDSEYADSLLEDPSSLAMEALRLGLQETVISWEGGDRRLSIPSTMALPNPAPGDNLVKLLDKPNPQVVANVLRAVEQLMNSQYPCGITWQDTDKSRWGNQALAELAGLSIEEVGSREIAPLYSNPQAQQDLAEIKRLFTQQSRFSMNYLADIKPGVPCLFRSDFELIEGEKPMRRCTIYECQPTSIPALA